MHYTNFNQTCQRNKKSISHSWYLSQLSPAEPPATICRSAFLRGWEGVTVSTGCCTLTTVVDGDVDASAVAMTLDLSLMLEERPEFLKRFSQRQCRSTTRNLQVKWFIYTVTNEGGNTWNNGTQPPQRWFNFNPEAHRISTHMRWCDLHVYSVNVLALNRTIVVPCSTCRGVLQSGCLQQSRAPARPHGHDFHGFHLHFSCHGTTSWQHVDETALKVPLHFKVSQWHNAESTARVGGQ